MSEEHDETKTAAEQGKTPVMVGPEAASDGVGSDDERVSSQMEEAATALASAPGAAQAWREAAAEAEALAAASIQATLQEIERNGAEIAAIRTGTAAIRARRLAVEEEIRMLAARAVQRATPAGTPAPNERTGGQRKLAH